MTKPSLALLLSVDAAHDYIEWRAVAVTLGPRYEADEPHADDPDHLRRPLDSDADVNGLHVADLAITAYSNTGDTADDRLYGLQVHYRNAFSVDVYRAARMARTLKTIDRRLQQLNIQFGVCDTYPQYVARVAHTMRVSQLVFRASDDHRQLTGRRYHINSVKDGVWSLQRTIDHWRANGHGRTVVWS